MAAVEICPLVIVALSPARIRSHTAPFCLPVLELCRLSCLVQLNQQTILDGNRLFDEFRGALMEQFVLQELKTLQALNIRGQVLK
jgi:uncharacterized protein